MPDKVVLSFEEVKSRYFSQDVHKSDEKTLGAVYDVLVPYFDLPVTPENMWQIQRQVLFLVKMKSYVAETNKLLQVLSGALTGAGVVFGSAKQRRRY